MAENMALPWLKDLEERVQEASGHLRDLRSENAALKERVAELESQLAAAPDAEQGTAWAEEKAEIRGRVEKLAEHLETLLQDG